jgi:tRNA pseudouridine38-40 synthase
MRNIKLVLEYDGTDFHGYQVQPGVRTVQGVIESILRELFENSVRLTAAGRTDQGVHARGQVVNFQTGSGMSPDAIRCALNGRLSPDIVVHASEEVEAEFHARYSAKSRVYQYSITSARSPLARRYAWELKYNLDTSNMDEAASLFVGTHDFSSFCVAKSRVDGPTCVVYSSVWKKREDLLVYEIEASRFLHNMVRIMVGSMVEVGRGKLRAEELREMLAARDRRKAGPTAPPHGLCLVEVKY